MKVLIVDDNPIDLSVLESVLKAQCQPVEIDRFTDPIKALDALKMSPYSIAFLDISMPEISGFDLARFIRSNEKTLSLNRKLVVGITAHTGKVTVERGLLSGMDALVFKGTMKSDSIKKFCDIGRGYS